MPEPIQVELPLAHAVVIRDEARDAFRGCVEERDHHDAESWDREVLACAEVLDATSRIIGNWPNRKTAAFTSRAVDLLEKWLGYVEETLAAAEDPKNDDPDVRVGEWAIPSETCARITKEKTMAFHAVTAYRHRVLHRILRPEAQPLAVAA